MLIARGYLKRIHQEVEVLPLKFEKTNARLMLLCIMLVIVFQLLGICYLIIRVQQLHSINLLQGLIIHCINI